MSFEHFGDDPNGQTPPHPKGLPDQQNLDPFKGPGVTWTNLGMIGLTGATTVALLPHREQLAENTQALEEVAELANNTAAAGWTDLHIDEDVIGQSLDGDPAIIASLVEGRLVDNANAGLFLDVATVGSVACLLVATAYTLRNTIDAVGGVKEASLLLRSYFT